MASEALDQAASGTAVRQVAAGTMTDPAARYHEVRNATVALCGPLEPEDYVVQSMPDASPAKWHLAHTSWFFEEFVLQVALPHYRFHDDRFRFLFNSYYNAVGPMHRRPQRGLLSRPTVAQVFAYRRHVDDHMGNLLAGTGLDPGLEQIATLGLHHEQQHQELLLTDLKHLLSCNPLLPAYQATLPLPRPGGTALKFKKFTGGTLEIGHAGSSFCFDNERPRHREYLRPFALANRLVTNAEYLQFIRSGGYAQPDLWLSDGWSVVQADGWQRPLYWMACLEQEFTLGGTRELLPEAPVCHLSFYEADAFARWAGARLPTEAEWETAARETPLTGNFAESGLLHPAPAAAGGSGSHALQLFGDTWEWTQSAYSPYPGFRPLAGALGEYNGKFMINQLVLRGGSCVTARTHMRATYRNFFSPAARWQFSGLRLARDG